MRSFLDRFRSASAKAVSVVECGGSALLSTICLGASPSERERAVEPARLNRCWRTALPTRASVASLALGALVFFAPVFAHAALSVVSPQCEGLSAPLGIDVAQPRLSWKLEAPADARGQRQSAYRVLVATSAETLARDVGDLWDSGRVASANSRSIHYGGKLLASSQTVFWKVRAFDAAGEASAWSEPASWTMGILASPGGAPGWRSGTRWITDAALLRYARPLGFSSETTTDENAVKWVQLDLGASQKIDSVSLHAVRHTVAEGLGFPRRFKVEASDDPAFGSAVVIADQSAADFRNAWATRIPLTAPSGDIKARYVRLTANRLRTIEGVACLALSQIEVSSNGKNIAAGAKVSASDSREDGIWSSASVADGIGVPRTNPLANSSLLLSREFSVRPGLRRALFHVSGLGHYELTANGARLGDGLLTPGWTDYAKTCFYDTHDLTAQLRTGPNAIGLCLAGGMYNVQDGRYVKFVSAFRPLMAFGELRLEYEDGTVEIVGTDSRWRVSTEGPVTFSNVFGGEDYDARRELPGWDRPGFAAAEKWSPAAETKGPGGALLGVSHASPPFRTFDVFKPSAVREIKPGVSVYDFGQNASVMPRLRVRGPAGSVVRMIPAELVREDGSVNRGSAGNGPAWWQYTLRGDPAGEAWYPKFFYHGSRYFQVELTAPEGAALPAIESLESVVVHSDSPPAGDFACSNELFNRIRTLIRWAQRSNLAHVLTDCPHRERLGWLEQYHLNGPALRYEWDLARLYRKCFRDMADAQTESGLVPDIAPEYIQFNGGFRDSPEWGSAVILAAWQHCVFTGDEMALRENYPVMQRYAAYLKSRSQDGIVSHGLGDWYDVGPKRPGMAQLTPVPLTATAIYFEITRTLGLIAGRFGMADDARRYAAEAVAIGEAFNKKFFDEEKRTYATGSQTSLAMPLALDLVPAAHRDAVLNALVAEIQSRGNAVTAGDVGYRYLLRALSAGGRSDVIFAMNNQSEKPGYGYQLAKGATSLTEAWDASGSSQNHFMLGQITEWFYHDLAGLQPDPTAPGFKRIVIKPAVVAGLTWVRASHETPYGRAESRWERDNTILSLDITIPVGTTAVVHVPLSGDDNETAVNEGSRPAIRSPGVKYLRVENGAALFEVGSGRYGFSAPVQRTSP